MSMETKAYRAAVLDLPYSVRTKLAKKHLRPWLCPQCQRDGLQTIGQCPKCLEARAHNIEWLETHSFILSNDLQSYHSNANEKKALPLRLPSERPTLFYGIELELEFDHHSLDLTDCDDDEEEYYNDNLDALINRINEETGGLCVFERDGSLNNGMELIFRPMSYKFLTHPETVRRLEKMAELLLENGAIKEPSGAGIHIHASTAFFKRTSDGYSVRDGVFEDFDWVFNVFQPQMEMLGGRKFTMYCQSKIDTTKNRYGTDKPNNIYGATLEQTVVAKLNKGKGMPSGSDHHVAANLRDTTLETRIFQSTLDVDKILSYVEIIRNLAHAVRDNELEGRTLNDILHTKENLYLDAYIERCRKQAYKTKYEFDLDDVFTSSITLDGDYNMVKEKKQKEKIKCVL